MSNLLTIRCLILATLASASVARAEPLSIEVGQTKTLTLSVQLSRIEVEDASVLTARHQGQQVELQGTALGTTSLHLVTAGGDELNLVVRVVNQGSTVYSFRSLPGHSGAGQR